MTSPTEDRSMARAQRVTRPSEDVIYWTTTVPRMPLVAVPWIVQ